MTEIPVQSVYGLAEGEPELPAPGDTHGLMIWLGRMIRSSAPSRASEERRQRLQWARSAWPLIIDPVPMTIAGGAGVLDVPQLLSPRLGRQWDVLTVSATGFTAGTVSGWRNLPAGATAAQQGALRVPFPAAGVQNLGKAQCWLRYGDRLVFIATGITPAAGQILISLDGVDIADEYVGEYLI